EGGGTERLGYTLDNDEWQRIATNAIEISAPDANQANDLLLLDLSITGSGQQNGMSSVDIHTQGSMRVEGGVDYDLGNASDELRLAADDRFELVTAQDGVLKGHIRMHDSDGIPTGQLTITGNEIWAADYETLLKLEADPNYTGRDDDLAAGNGVAGDED